MASDEESYSASESGTDCYDESFSPFPLMNLPPELQAEVFCRLNSLKEINALRLCCRQLNDIYQKNQDAIFRPLLQDLVAPFREFYDFLGTLSLPAGSVRHPPPGGWPNFKPAEPGGLNKTPFALSVLKHLSYIDNGGYRRNQATCIDYKCNVVDYTSLKPEQFKHLEDDVQFWAVEWQGDPADQDDDERISHPKHIIMIADGYESGGVVLLLDTFTGTVFEEIVRCSWGVRLPPYAYCQRRIERLKRLEQVFIPFDDPVELDIEEYDAEAMEAQGEPTADGSNFGEDEEDYYWVSHLYRRFGWPGKDWKKDECMEAITGFIERREG